jgi:Tol biopolymer transport system component
MKTKYIFSIPLLLLITALLSACRTLDVYVETAVPSTSTAVESTATDTPQTNQVDTPAQPTLTSEPTVVPTPDNTPTVEPAATATLLPGPTSPFAGLVYRLGEQLLRVGYEGQQVPLAPGLDPQVLPGQFTPRAVFSVDGKYMVSWWDYSDLWLVDLTTGQSLNLTQTPDRVEYAAQFWPDRPDSIIFMSQPVDDQGPSGAYLSTIQVDGSGYRVLDDTASSIGQPALSSDGQTIAYDHSGEAWLYRWDSGSEALDLASYQVNDSLKLANPAWSPKSKYLAWMGTINPGSSNSQAGLALFNIEANNYRLLHTFQSAGRDGWYNTPVWSPDGTWLVIFDESQTQPGVWVTHPDGSGDTLVYAASSSRSVRGLQVLWSADSIRLMVIDPNAEGGLRLELIDIFTGQRVILPLPTGALPLAWTQSFLPVTPIPTPGQGTITGRICFPSERIPAMKAYFQNITNNQVVEMFIVENQSSYAVTLPAGEYIASAWLPDFSLGGLYSEFVLCGMGPECVDHTPIRFQVESGQDTNGIDICDWYTHPDLPSQPTVSIFPTSGPSGTLVQVTASGFPANTSVPVGLGPANSEFGEVGRGVTDANGFFTLQVPIQGEVGMDWIFSAYAGDTTAVSTPFRITNDVPADTLTVFPLSMPTPTPNMDMWTTFTNPAYAISLQYPADWQPVSGYGSPETGETRFAAINGFFQIGAMDAASIDDVAAAEAGHRLQPYGSQPTIETLQIQNQEARLILPSADQPAGMLYQAALIVRYPQPVNLVGTPCHYFVLLSDLPHIQAIAQTLRFTN